MSYTTIYNQEPQAVQYMPLPDGAADVWLRQNIRETTDDEGSVMWAADEVYFRTSLAEDDVTENFDALFATGGPVTDSDTGEAAVDGITTADRLDALEAAVMELAEVIANG